MLTVTRADMYSRHQNAPPTKEGELLKYRNIWSGWEPRYFKLERTYLHYYESKHSPSPKDTVLRSLIVKVKPSAAFPERDFVFEIQQRNGNVWYCQATSMQEMVEWMSVISNTPLFIDTQQYLVTYPQSGLADPLLTGSEPGLAPSAPSVPHSTHGVQDTDHHHLLYPCLHQDFSELTSDVSQSHSPPPSYSEAVRERIVPQR